MIRASHDLQLNTGMLVAVPIPAAAAAEGAAIEQAIQQSLQEADDRGIAGAEVSGMYAAALSCYVCRGMLANVAIHWHHGEFSCRMCVSITLCHSLASCALVHVAGSEHAMAMRP